ncbi:MAG TPA: hypothetical protein VFX78_04850 [Candidatus Eisenbacteria bacterium]|nr:hypothetical protein [Candidatus Eisenbacteria bacterium]
MAALRALLFAVFGGFIGAAPAAPAVPDRAGHDAGANGAVSHSQKSEHPTHEIGAPLARDRAAAPPCTDTPGSAPAFAPPRETHRPSRHVATATRLSGGGTPLPPVADVRAGLLDLPPPAR